MERKTTFSAAAAADAADTDVLLDRVDFVGVTVKVVASSYTCSVVVIVVARSINSYVDAQGARRN
jgi:hypothetical protein